MKMVAVDEEWKGLLKEARDLGLTPKDIRIFLAKKSYEKKVHS
ncbi:anti-repressor SinI family protein [Evansella cellulosilytica]|nr:anti-repressor SinI family protein [Evansella cellulosilytica]